MTSPNKPLTKPSTKEFRTLLKSHRKEQHITEKNYEVMWYPVSTDTYWEVLKIDTTEEENERIMRNISYSLQYLEFINKELSELELSSVLEKMLNKTYVIVGSSIIEALFKYTLKKHGLLNSKMGYCKMIDKLKENDKDILNIGTKNYELIHDVRKLRNHVHLTEDEKQKKSAKTEDEQKRIEHDYNVFIKNAKDQTNDALRIVFSSKEITNNPEYFSFFNISKS